MFIRKPMLKRFMTSEVPPKLINARGVPLLGSNPETTLILIRDWKVIKKVIPTAK